MIIGRREFLVGGTALAATAGASARLAKSNSGLDPRSHGARGDGNADDTGPIKEALTRAFNEGVPIDGGDAIFAVSGDIAIHGRVQPYIKSLRLRQLSAAQDRKTLYFKDCQNIRIDGLQIDVGQARAIGRMNDSGGLWIDGGSGHDVRNVEAFGHGKNSLIAIWNTSQSKYSNLNVHDARFDDPSARDDSVQAIRLLRCTDCVVQSPSVANLSGNGDPRFPSRFTRGIVLGGCLRVSILDARVSNVDQGIDITGSDGNLDCVVQRARCFQCSAVGVKLANSAVRCKIADTVVERSGLMGFLASGPSEPNLRNKTRDCDFVRCTAIDPGYNGFQDSAPHAGFRVERNRFDPEYPMGIRFVDCRAIDQQPVKTMEYGFYDHVQNGAGAEPNKLINCQSEGATRGLKFGDWH